MPTFSEGDRVRVRAAHPGCTWCQAVRGQFATVVMVRTVEDTEMVDVAIDPENGRVELVMMKTDCIEPV